MNYNQFKNLSCYEEFEIQCALAGISKIDVLKEIGHQIHDYYFFVSNDGIFNWFDLNGNHVEYPIDLMSIGLFEYLPEYYIPKTISKCVIPNNVTNINNYAFYYCKLLKEITIPNNVINIGVGVFYGCKSLTSINISNSVTSIGSYVFSNCESLKEVIFKGKTLEEVKRMENYPFGIEDTSIIKCEL